MNSPRFHYRKLNDQQWERTAAALYAMAEFLYSEFNGRDDLMPVLWALSRLAVARFDLAHGSCSREPYVFPVTNEEREFIKWCEKVKISEDEVWMALRLLEQLDHVLDAHIPMIDDVATAVLNYAYPQYLRSKNKDVFGDGR